MSEASAAPGLVGLALPALLPALFGPAPQIAVPVGPGDIVAFETTLEDRRLIVAALDASKNGGSIGRLEADQLVSVLKYARSRAPLALVLNTSGIRVTDGAHGIASLRKILREVEEMRLQGGRLLALIVKQAFGGASLLAALCERRIVHPGCLFSMSGPRLIEQSAGVVHFDAGNRDAVRALLGGEARAAMSSGFLCVEESPAAYHRAVADWLCGPGDPILGAADLDARADALVARAS